MRRWIARSLNRKFMVAAVAGLFTVSLIFLLVFVTLYHNQLQEERALKAAEVNRLLQATLVNAMLKRDLEGLREIIDGLGQEETIRQVMILNPSGEARFASDAKLIGTWLVKPEDPVYPSCLPANALIQETRLIINDATGQGIRRAVHPIRNRPACAQCHGQTDVNPINGVLVVDHETETLRARSTAPAC